MSDDRMAVVEGYQELLGDLKERIRSAQIRAALAVNRELVLLYWEIGRAIAARQEEYGWGAQVIARLSADLRRAFPDMKGFSPRNLQYMRTFAGAYPDKAIAQQVVAQLPWGHNVRLLDAVPDPVERDGYARKAIEHGWSRAMLIHHVDARLYKRQGRADTNFSRTLPTPQSDLAQQILKDPYNFDFLSRGEWAPLVQRVAADSRMGGFPLLAIDESTAGEAGSAGAAGGATTRRCRRPGTCTGSVRCPR